MDNMEPLRAGRIVNIAVYENPNSKATIFMLHGLGGRGAQWREQINVLQKEYTLIVPDLLGHGKSSKPIPSAHHNPYEFLDFLQDIAIIFKKYAGKENIIIGHSFGGALAAFFTANHLENVKKLILIAPVTCERKEIPSLYKMPLFILKLYRPQLEKKFRAAAFNSSATLDLLNTEDLEDKNNEMYVIKGMMKGLQHIPYLHAAQITIPTLIIFGETDHIISIIKSTAFYESIPKRKFVALENAGHMVMLEQPAAVNALIENFLRE